MRFCTLLLGLLALGSFSSVASATPEEWPARQARMTYEAGGRPFPPFAREFTLVLMNRKGEGGQETPSALVIEPSGTRYPILWTSPTDEGMIFYGVRQHIFSVLLRESEGGTRWTADVNHDLVSWQYSGIPERAP